MDEMWSSYHDKNHQIRLWRAVYHETGEAAAFWFGTGEHKNPDKLLELLKPLKELLINNMTQLTGGYLIIPGAERSNLC
jgi:IS1 family transposase